MLSWCTQVLRRCTAVRGLFDYAISQGPGDLLEEPLQAGLKHATDVGLCPPGCRVVVLADNLSDGPDTLPVMFSRVSCALMTLLALSDTNPWLTSSPHMQ